MEKDKVELLNISSGKFWAVHILLSLFVTFSFSAGKVVDLEDSLNLKSASFWIMFIGIFAVASILLIVMYALLKKLKLQASGIYALPKACKFVPAVTWTLSLLACFPGVFSYDCYEEWQMVANGNLTNHHPVLHVIILGGLTNISNNVFGNGNAGIAIYVLMQMLFGLFVISKVLDFFEEISCGKKIQIFSLIFYSLSPVVLMYIVATTKDSIFTLFEVWFVIACLRISNDERVTRPLDAELILSSLGTMIFRKNGLYICGIALICLLIIKRKIAKRLISSILVITAVYLLYAGPFSKALIVKQASSAEMLSVPIQQMARVLHFEKDTLTSKDIESMYKYIDEEYWTKYIPTTADAVKMGFKQAEYEKDRVGFFKTWLRVGIRHPMTYINAWLANTVDFWYPFAVSDGYRWLYGMDESKSNYFDYRVAEPGQEIVFIRPLHQVIVYFSEDKGATTNPLLAVLLNPGWYVVFWLISLAYSILQEQRQHIIFHVTMALSFATVLMGPMALVRYVLVFFFVFPIELAIIAGKGKTA